MKGRLLLVGIIMLCIGCSQSGENKQPLKEAIKDLAAIDHIANRQDPAKWDTSMFRSDLENLMDMNLPFTSGVFPVPKYELQGEGSFKGLGNFGYPGGEGIELKVDDKSLLFNSFFVKKNTINEQYIEAGNDDEVFFHIIVLTDFVDTVDYTHTMSEVVSRNHPDYIAQGFYKTSNNRIDYTAFITADRNAYAIVDMRLFDLTKGKTILIAPLKDKSLRSMQIDSPPMSSKEIETYTKELVKQKDVREFFVGEGSI
jgi:hypothetical protein